MHNKEWFIDRYLDLHENLAKLETEIENHISDKSDIIGDDHKLEDLKMRTVEIVNLLYLTREEERRIFNYGTT